MGKKEGEIEKKVLGFPQKNILPGAGVLSHAADDIPQNTFPY